ncbi:MAG: thiamine phosphate synthase [Bacteroidia bacterium]
MYFCIQIDFVKMQNPQFSLVLVHTCEHVHVLSEKMIEAFCSGTELIHIRPGTLNQASFRTFLESLPGSLYQRIVIHGHYELAASLKLRGIHLTESARARGNSIQGKKAGSGIFSSASFHDLHDLIENGKHYSYVFLSPVFPSISKEGYEPAFDRKELKMILGSGICETPVYALGGIDQDTLLLARELGFQGAALHGALLTTPDPVQLLDRMRILLGANA